VGHLRYSVPGVSQTWTCECGLITQRYETPQTFRSLTSNRFDTLVFFGEGENVFHILYTANSSPGRSGQQPAQLSNSNEDLHLLTQLLSHDTNELLCQQARLKRPRHGLTLRPPWLELFTGAIDRLRRRRPWLSSNQSSPWRSWRVSAYVGWTS